MTRILRTLWKHVAGSVRDLAPIILVIGFFQYFILQQPLDNALGLAIGASRRRNTLWAGFGATIAAAFGYYLLMDFGLELGRSGVIPPM